MKALIYFSLLFIKISLLPDVNLLLWALLAIAADFLTGYAKAVALNQERTSGAIRRSFPKFLQYVGSIVVSVILAQTAPPDQRHLLAYVGDGLVVLIIYTESVSILENLIAMGKENLFAQYVLVPLHKILTLQIKRNPAAKAADAIDNNNA